MESVGPGDGDAVLPVSEEPTTAEEVPPAVDGAAAVAGEVPANGEPAADAGGASTDGPGDGAVAAAGPDAGAVTSAQLQDAIDQLLKETDLQSVCVGKFRRRLLGTE